MTWDLTFSSSEKVICHDDLIPGSFLVGIDIMERTLDLIVGNGWKLESVSWSTRLSHYVAWGQGTQPF